MRITLDIDGASTAELRTVTRELSRFRDEVGPDGSGRPCWAPRVHCDGPERWHITTAALPLAVASRVVAELDALRTAGASL